MTPDDTTNPAHATWLLERPDSNQPTTADLLPATAQERNLEMSMRHHGGNCWHRQHGIACPEVTW